MGYVQIDPDSEKRFYLPKAGLWGSGLQHGGDVELVAFEYPTEKSNPLDKDGAGGPYAWFLFKVSHPDYGIGNIRSFQSGKAFSGGKALAWVRKLGVPVDENNGFDTSMVAPRKCGIEVRAPREDRNSAGVWYTGEVNDVIGLEG